MFCGNLLAADTKLLTGRAQRVDSATNQGEMILLMRLIQSEEAPQNCPVQSLIEYFAFRVIDS